MTRFARKPLRAVVVLTSVASLAVAASVLSVAIGVSAQGSAGNSGPSSISHFTCYLASAPSATSAPPPFTPTPVILQNQFAPTGFYTNVGAVIEHCNPVRKTINSASGQTITPIVNPNDHLLCFALSKPPTQPSYTVIATNQFGTGELTTGKPVTLCLPTWKNQPNIQALIQPPGLDHYVCYQASYTKSAAGTSNPTFTPPAGMTLQDQFMPAPVPATIGTPNLLCLPTVKIVQPAAAVPGLQNPQAHLVCFPVTPVKVKVTPPAQVTDQNQFGYGSVDIKKLFELCVPSYKDVINPTTGTTVNPGVIVVSATDPTTGIGLVGSTFQASDSTGVVQGTCTTDYSGMCSIKGLVPGTFTVTMTNPPPSGYSSPAPQTVNVSGGNGSFVSIVPPWPWSA